MGTEEEQKDSNGSCEGHRLWSATCESRGPSCVATQEAESELSLVVHEESEEGEKLFGG